MLGSVAMLLLATAMTMSACSSDETTSAAPDGGTSDAATDTIARSDTGAGEPEAGPGCNAGAAPDPLTYEVKVIEAPSPLNALPGATVDLVKRSDRSVITTGTSDANGKVTLSAPTGGVALDALLRVTAPPGDAGPRMPFVTEFQYGIQKDENANGVGVPAQSLIADNASAAGVTLDPSKTIVQVHVGNCNGNGFTNATVAVEGATVIYNKGGPMTFDTSMTATGLMGVGTAFNVAPGLTKISVTYMGQTITHETNTVAGEIHWIFVKP